MAKEKGNIEEYYDPFGLETKEIHAEWWPEGCTVTVQEVTYAKSQAIAKLLISQDLELPRSKRAANKERRTYGDLDTDVVNLHTTLAAINSWGFKDHDGNPVPLTLENVKKLKSRDANFIEEGIELLNPERDEDFHSGSGDSEIAGDGETTS